MKRPSSAHLKKVSETRWHSPKAIEHGRRLYGILWNPDDATEEQADEILWNLGQDLREKYEDGERDPS